MTADLVKGKGFRGALCYNLKKVDQGVAKILDMSFVKATEQSIMKELQMVRVLRPNLAKYFYHTSVNFPPNEDLSDGQMKRIASDYLHEMGFDQHQFAVIRHFDADHPHFHLLVNRIGYDGTVVSDSKDYQRTEQILRRLEKQYGLTEVLSSKQAKERAMTKNELEMMIRTDKPSVKMLMQEIIKSVLEEKPNAEQFIKQLEARGINVLFNQASTGFVSGISYGYGGMQFKGAHLGNAYKWQAVKNSISYEQERDRTTIYQANVKTRAGQSARAGQATAERRTTTAHKSTANNELRGADQKIILRSIQDEPGNKSRLQERIRQGGLSNSRTHQQAEQAGGEHGVEPTADQARRRTSFSADPAGGQKVDSSNLSDSHFIGDLLGVNNDIVHVDLAAVNEFKRKRKKKRGHRLG